ncbi:hypothetical protein [Rhodococcus sp. NPDC058514]|uniref:hypothetical protein n=1 Tax=unclassified Rhodococcus (in: high G+C Gram-positive bacteria) TaxID=192944 RepID=UPI003661FB86
MNRRFVASLMFVAAGVLAVPATAHATPTTADETCSTTNQTNDNEDCASGGSSILDLAELLKSFSGGAVSGLG